MSARARWHPVRRAAGLLLAAAVTVLGVALVLLPMATGSVPLTVLTGSMSPTYPPGSVVVVRPTPVSQLRVGDPITYQLRSGDPEVVTHRITSIVFTSDGTRELITQGDANGAPDLEPVIAAQVRGRVWYSVPWVGHAVTAVSPDVRELATKLVAGGLVLHGLVLIGRGLRERRGTGAPAGA
jgi:signal peptidase